jgi:muramoyltetrapeptide carboxypeptidase LdcA involved in peptidoglycan recycling
MKIALIACSDGLKNSEKQREKYNQLIMFLKKCNLEVVEADKIFREDGHIYSGKPEERAKWLNQFFSDKTIKYIFDVSGGDSGNEILEYIDYNIAVESKAKTFAQLIAKKQ